MVKSLFRKSLINEKKHFFFYISNLPEGNKCSLPSLLTCFSAQQSTLFLAERKAHGMKGGECICRYAFDAEQSFQRDKRI